MGISITGELVASGLVIYLPDLAFPTAEAAEEGAYQHYGLLKTLASLTEDNDVGF